MAYTTVNLIAPYNFTDKYFTIQDSLGNDNFNIIPTSISKISSIGTLVQLSLQTSSGAVISLEFSSANEAKIAEQLIVTASNTLYSNAKNLGGSIIALPDPIVILSRTLAQYIAAAGANSLVPFQQYAISDDLSVLGIGTTYVFQALRSNDMRPNGVTPNGASFKADLTTMSISSLQDSTKGVSLTNSSIATLIGTSKNISAANDSNITATNSDNITAINNSILNVTSCNNIVAQNNAIVTATNCSNVIFSGVGIVVDSLLSLSDVTIDAHSTTGKKLSSLENLSILTELVAYKNGQDVTLLTPLMANRNTPIRHLMTRVGPSSLVPNAQFIFGEGTTSALFGGFAITFLNEASVPLITCDAAYAGATVVFKYDNVLVDWIVSDVKNIQVKIANLSVPLLGTIIFAIPTSVLRPTTSIFTINGQVQKYGVDYTIVGTTLNYISSDYILETSNILTISYQ